jgi:quinoprotein dehydrogenase-associated probable ABC transporter substrate-binding protein
LLACAAAAVADGEFRVCADPNNLPFSNQKREGFENKIAALLADDLHAKLSYTWLKQRQGFIRQTLNAQRCDIVIGVPDGFERVLTTPPYYRSTYVFVSAKRQKLAISSFADPALRTLKIGLHAVGNDGANTPPAHALAQRGIVNNIVGFPMWDAAVVNNPPGRIVDAVAKGQIDIAIVWGPIGGYFAHKQHGNALTVTPVADADAMPDMPFSYAMSIGVRKNDEALATRLQQSLERKQHEIHDILTAYHIPLIELAKASPTANPSPPTARR